MPLKLALFVLMAAEAFALVTPSPTTLAFTMRQGYAFPWNGTQYPPNQTITLTGTGAWSAAISGTLSTGCGGPCFSVSPTSGSGAGSITVSFSGLGSESLAAGAPTGTIVITGGTANVSVTLTVVAHNPYDLISPFNGVGNGCANSNAGFQSGPLFAPFVDTCTITNERPTSTSFSIPAATGTYVDPQHGATVTRLTASGNQINYGATTAFSATSKYVLTSDISGNVNIFNRATGALTYAAIAVGNIANTWWDSVDDEKVWFISGGQIKNLELNTSVTTTAADYTSSSGGRPAFTFLSIGGTEDMTDDGWIAFCFGNSGGGSCDETNPKIAGVNLSGLTTGNQESHICYGDYSGLGITNLDFPQMTQVDPVSNKRYVLAMAISANHVWSCSGSSLSYEYQIPTANGVSPAPHSDVGQDQYGRQVLFFTWADTNGNQTYLATGNIAAGATPGTSIIDPVEVGGGLRILFPTTASNTDAHFGGTWRGVFSYTPYGNATGILPYFHISSIVNGGSACTLTLVASGASTNPASSTSIQIGGSNITAINGIWTWTNTGALTGTIPTGCAGSYTANSGKMAVNAVSASNGPLRQEVILSRPGTSATRLAIHRTKIYGPSSTETDAYYATPRASISRDGAYIAYASNMGIPENPSVYVVATGYTTVSSGRISGAVRIGGRVVIH